MGDKENKIDIEKQLKVKVTMISGMLTGALFKSILHPVDTLKVKILVRLIVSKDVINKRNFPSFIGLIQFSDPVGQH